MNNESRQIQSLKDVESCGDLERSPRMEKSNQDIKFIKRCDAKQVARKIRQLAKLGSQKVQLSDFVIKDRENH